MSSWSPSIPLSRSGRTQACPTPDSGESFQSDNTVYEAFIIDPADRIHITTDHSNPITASPTLYASLVRRLATVSPLMIVFSTTYMLLIHRRGGSPVNPNLLRTFTRRYTLSYKC